MLWHDLIHIKIPPPSGRWVYGFVQYLVVDFHIFEPHVPDALENIGFGYILKDTIPYINIGGRRALIGLYQQGVLALFAGHIFQIDIAHRGSKLACVLFAVIEIDLENRIAHLADGNISHVDVFHESASHGVAFDSQGAIQVGAVHNAVFDKDISHTAGHFAAHNDASVAVLHLAVAHHDILGGDIDPPAVVVFAGFDRDTIVSRIEITALDQNIAAGIGITSVAVWPVIFDSEISDRDVLAVDGVYIPERAVDEGESLDQDVLTIDRAYKCRAPVGILAALDALGEGDIVLCPFGIQVVGYAIRAGFLFASPCPPCFSLPVECPFACDGIFLQPLA